MKNKSSRHKSENTFKFIPFAERINNIDVDIFHKVAHEYETQLEEDECIFHQTIVKWNVLNLTEFYDNFKKDIHSFNVITLPQLIFNKENIKDVLIKHLSLKNELALQPLLDLVVALAKDLRQDFYPFYHEFLQVLVSILHTNNSEVLEWTFHCLAYLFKFLWRPMISDIGNVFKNLLPLLSEEYHGYINNFAAESFSFVARKVKDFKSFLFLILKNVKNHKDGISGCGRLIFEVLKGITGHFHSSSSTVLPILIDALNENNSHQEELYQVLEKVIEHITTTINPQHGDLLYTTLIASITKQKAKNLADENIAKTLNLQLTLLGQSLEYKSGKFLNISKSIVVNEIQTLIGLNLPTTIALTIAQIAIVLLHSHAINLTQAEASCLVQKSLNQTNEDVLLYFVEHSFDYPMFSTMILPAFLKFFTFNEAGIVVNEKFVTLLSKLVLHKAPMCFHSAELITWLPFTIDFGDKNECFADYLSQFVNENVENLENSISKIVIIPHLKDINTKSTIRDSFLKNIEKLIERIDKNKEANSLDADLLLLIVNIEIFIHLSQEINVEVANSLVQKLINSLLSLSIQPNNLWALKSLDLFFTIISLKCSTPNEVLTEILLQDIHKTLKINFNSPYHKIRLHTTHIYSLFEPYISYKMAEHSWNVFSLCYKVESTNPQVDTYRDQLQCLEKFNFDKPQMQMAKNTDFCDIPLRYLCGVLYMNFKLLWEPVVGIIASIANGMEIDTFWCVYVEELLIAAKNVRELPVIMQNNVRSCENIDCFEFISKIFEESRRIEDKSDFLNYRILLWKAMTSFAHVAEARNRDVVNLFLSFVNEEYLRTNSDVAFVLNIKQETQEDLDVLEVTAMDVDEENVESIDRVEKTKEELELEHIKKELKKPVPKYGGKAVLKLLLHHLHVFAKAKNPKSMVREPELYKLYFEFLAHKNAEVQKAVLDCLMTYKNKSVKPYSQHLYNLIDEKLLRNELIQFKLDRSSEQIQPQHRESLIPFVLKIVYSKMVMKTGGKSGGQQRRNMIFRFLSGCDEREMLLFIEMAFKFYEKYFSKYENVLTLVDHLTKNIDLENFIPPKRLLSTQNLLQVVFENFGNLMNDKILSFVLRIILCIGATLKGAFLKSSEIHVGYNSILRTLRTSSIRLIEQFSSRFEYPWSAGETDAVFDVFVWPYINKLDTEGIHSPTTLLKLLGFWASNPRYYQLLVKHHQDDIGNYPLKHLIKLLMNPKVHLSVNNFIMEMLENLLKLTLDDGEVVIPVNNVLPIEDTILLRLKVPENNLNYGSCILLPHVPQILAKMKEKLIKKKKAITKRDLIILSRISELVWEADISDSTLDLIIPIVSKKTRLGAKEEELLQLLATIKNLLHNVQDPKKHLKTLSPLFGYVKEITCRKILCQILSDISTINSEYSLITEILSELNAYNTRWIDQPDFDRRISAFRRIESLFKDGKLSLELSILLIYNSFYTLSIEKDLSLRECAVDCLKSITPPLVLQYSGNQQQKEYILDHTLFPIIKSGFKSSSAIRNDCISLLGHLARECGDVHVVLGDLSKLTNKVDLEVDFFENLVHLQLHRQGRALLKVKEVFSREERAPNIRTLTQYLLPLATHYLCNDQFVSKHTLLDNACDVVQTCAKLMPWHHYEAMLKLYLSKLMHDVPNQKQLVKIVVCILDAYHFDLHKGLEVEIDDNEDQIETKDKIVTKEEQIKTKEEKIQLVEHETEINEEEDDNDEENDEFDDAHDEEEEEEVEDPEEDEKLEEKVKPYDKITILCKSAAKRVIRIIKCVLLPQLNRALAMKTTHENTHKLNHKRATREEREDEDLVRIPITLAVVKLLQRLPKYLLDRNLPGVIMKICTFLRTKLESVRRTARETLQKIVLTLGPDYLGPILGEMAGLQYKGYQMHVLVFTVHAMLNCLKEHYQPGHIDNVLLTVIDFCMQDLFGALAEEREVAKIANKTAEASSPKSFDTLQILAQFITEKCIMDMLLPIKKILGTSHSFKVVNKAEECLKQIALGLVDNKFMDVEILLKFAYGTASQSIPDLLYQEKRELTEKESEKLSRQKPDCYIIPKAPVGKSGVRVCKVKSSQTANAHLLIEFGLKLCNILLKRDKLKDGDFSSFMDPFVGVLKNCINTPHVKLNTISLQCMEWLLKYELPSLKNDIKDITKSLFAILHKYASAGLKKGDNFDLVMASFKTMAVLVRDVKYHVIQTEQLKVLLLYVEQDLYNHERQATAFGLLKAIIARKLIVPELPEIIMKVGELSITSELPHVRQQCRIVYHHYVMDYPLGKKLEKYVSFYLAQLSFELQTGRESALDMVLILINSFPINILKNFSGTFFVAIGTRLINDDVPSCRKMAAKCLTTMLTRLEKPDRDPLFDMLIIWFKDKKIQHKMLAAQICGLLINVETVFFESRIPTLIPVVFRQFNKENEDAPGKFVRAPVEDTEGFIKERNRDHHLYQVLQMLLKLCLQVPNFLKRTSDVENLAVRAQGLLSHDHDWVRLGAAQFLGFVLGAVDIEKLSKLLLNRLCAEDDGYLYSNPNDTLRSLSLDLCAQLVPGNTKTDLAEQVIKNLILIARVLQSVPINKQQAQEEQEENENEDNNTGDCTKRVNLLWLVKRVRRIINMEIVENSTSTTLRTALFKFIAALLTVIDINILRPILHHLLAPLVREIVTKEKSTDELIQLSREVSAIAKSKIGKNEYTKLLALIEGQLTIRRAERKRNRSQLAVTDPELYAKKKIKHNEKKKELKKKKISRSKGLFTVKKKTKTNVEIDADD